MSATRSKFLPSEDEFAQSVYSASLNYSPLKPGQGRWILVAALALVALLLLAFTASGEPTRPVKYFDQQRTGSARPVVPNEQGHSAAKFCSTKVKAFSVGPLRPVAEHPPRVDRYWPERRMCFLPDLRDSHRWVREQEKEAWHFVDSIGK